MTDFDPGEGWREVTGAHSIPAPCVTFSDGTTVRRWVRVPAWPPLPTEPYTVIEAVHPQHGAGTAMLGRDGDWHGWHNGSGLVYPADALRSLISFKVLAEPRAVTANAVLDRVRALLPHSAANEPRVGEVVSTIAREFGVQAAPLEAS